MARAISAPISVPLRGRGAMDRLMERPAYDRSARAAGLFLEALREAARIHCRRDPRFRGLWRLAGFSPSDLRDESDLARMPHVFVAALKERDFVSLPRREIVLELTSSGTSGQRSRTVLDKGSLLRVRRMVWQIFGALGMTGDGAVNDYLCFTYDPRVAKDVGTAFSDESLTGLTPRGEVFYALRWDPATKAFYFDMAGALAALERFESGGRPARLMGFPAHAMAVCDEFRARHGRAARLHPGSWVITGGGWKDKQDRAVDKGEMRARLAAALGLGPERVRDLFGMVEHGVPYVDCPLGNFHVPAYSRVIARHPATLEPLPYGVTGLLQFITPYLSSYPSISLLSSDKGRLEERCACGLGGPVMRVEGRAGVKKMKGCAISASTML